VVRCTKAVMPHMRTSRKGHIVNISSVGGLVGQPFNEIYCAAKFAVEGYTEGLASYIEPGFNVKFTIVEPGGIRTEFASNVFSNVQANGGVPEDEYKPIMDAYLAKARERAGAGGVYQTAQEVADVVVSCVESADPPLRCRTSEWGENFCRLKTTADPTGRLQLATVAVELPPK